VDGSGVQLSVRTHPEEAQRAVHDHRVTSQLCEPSVYLGAYGSSESKAEYARILAKLAVAPTPVVVTLAEIYRDF
jgi:hypothetical protein